MNAPTPLPASARVGDWHLVIASAGGSDLRGMTIEVSHSADCPRSATLHVPICDLGMDLVHFDFESPNWDAITGLGTYRARLHWDDAASVGVVEVEPMFIGDAMAMLLARADEVAS